MLQGGGSDGVDKNELLAMNLPLKHFLDGLFLDKVPSLSTAAMQKAQVYKGYVHVGVGVCPSPPSWNSWHFVDVSGGCSTGSADSGHDSSL